MDWEMIFLFVLTFENMNSDGADVANTGVTSILSRVLHPRLLDQEVGGGHLPLLCDLADPAPDGGVGDGLLVVVPEDVLRGLRTVLHQTSEVHGESFLQVYIRSTKNLSEGLWRIKRISNFVIKDDFQICRSVAEWLTFLHFMIISPAMFKYIRWLITGVLLIWHSNQPSSARWHKKFKNLNENSRT